MTITETVVAEDGIITLHAPLLRAGLTLKVTATLEPSSQAAEDIAPKTATLDAFFDALDEAATSGVFNDIDADGFK